MSIPGSANPLLLQSAAEAGGYTISRSVRFNSADSAYLSKTFGSAGNRKTWTWAGWVKRSGLGGTQYLFGATSDGFNVNYGLIYFASDKLIINDYVAGNRINLQTTALFRDPSAWYHIVFALDTTQTTSTDRCKLYVNGVQVTAFGTSTYPTQNTDLFVNSTNVHYLSYSNSTYAFSGLLADVFFIDGQALDPTSFGEFDDNGIWQPKAYSGGSYGTNGYHLDFADNSTAAALGTDTSGNGNNWTPNNFSVAGTTNHVTSGLSYRKGARFSNWDSSSADSTPSSSVSADNYWWIDLGSSKTFNRIEVDDTITGSSLTQFYFLASTSSSSSGTEYCASGCTGYSAVSTTGSAPGTVRVVFSGFGSITARYIAISQGYSSTNVYSNLRILNDQGKDNDSLVDVPTNGTASSGGDAGGTTTGNYCTWNPLGGKTAASPTAAIPTNGNLDVPYDRSSSGSPWVVGSIAVPASGKWYWELAITAASSSQPATTFGVISSDSNQANNFDAGGQTFRAVYNFNGNDYKEGGTYTTYASSPAVNDVIGIAVDMDAGSIYFSKNGSWANGTGSYNQTFSGAAAAFTDLVSTGKTWLPLIGINGGNSGTTVANFGARPFQTAAPAGFRSLNTANLPAPVITKPSEYMDVKLYLGNGTADGVTQTITGLSMSPDLVWIKSRSNAYSHNLYDAVRGVGQALVSNATTSETTTDALTQFTSDGFTVKRVDSGPYYETNANNATYAAWCFDAGSSTVSNTDGSISSQVRANASAGFSVAALTTQSSGTGTFGHGLGVAPYFYIVKTRGVTSNWWVYHQSLPTAQSNALALNTTGAAIGSTTLWNNTAPSSSLISLGADWAGSLTVVVYAFAPVDGYSAMGSYTGNGSADGPFVFLNFRARWIMFKRVAAADPWIMYDTARSPYNQLAVDLAANDSRAEAATSAVFDITSNGFKLRNSGTIFNQNGSQYIYCAFAESPFQYARAR